ncbi:hypothetical protein ACIP5N_22570 [Streptomyces sp. NPDC088768]|uniref:hypothetical protein n=1 Tax=Streptomyces sp. NPDC088768 TaxID=3365894 RepID=UPI003822A6D9
MGFGDAALAATRGADGTDGATRGDMTPDAKGAVDGATGAATGARYDAGAAAVAGAATFDAGTGDVATYDDVAYPARGIPSGATRASG